MPNTAPHADVAGKAFPIVGEKNAITNALEQEAYLTEDRGLYRGHTQVVLRPGSTRKSPPS